MSNIVQKKNFKLKYRGPNLQNSPAELDNGAFKMIIGEYTGFMEASEININYE